MGKLTLSVLAFATALVAAISWGRAPLANLTGMSPSTSAVVLLVTACLLIPIIPLALASYRASGKRAGIFVGSLVVIAVLLSGGFAAATPTWQSELKTTVAFAGPSAWFDSGEETCRDNMEQVLVTFEDMTLDHWRETNEVLTNESAAAFGTAALAATHFGSVIVDVVVQAVTKDKISPRIYGDAHELADKWELRDGKSKRFEEDGRAFFSDVLEHIEDEHKEGLSTLKKLKGQLKRSPNSTGKTAKQIAADMTVEKVDDRWVLRDDNAKDPDSDVECVREDGRWRLDLVN